MLGPLQRLIEDPLTYENSFKHHVKHTIHTFNPNEKILIKGETYPFFCYLKNGTVRVVLSDISESKLRPIIADLKPHQIFGDMGLLNNAPTVADIIAVTEAEVVRIDKRSFLAFIKTNPELGNEILLDFMQMLFDRIKNADATVFNLVRAGIGLQKNLK